LIERHCPKHAQVLKPVVLMRAAEGTQVVSDMQTDMKVGVGSSARDVVNVRAVFCVNCQHGSSCDKVCVQRFVCVGISARTAFDIKPLQGWHDGHRDRGWRVG
jgi:hypothetical protein